MRTILQAGQIIKKHNITNLCLLIFFFFGIPFSGFGQRSYLFENISIPEGLSNSGVQFIFQDSNGFLWISTSDGLNRYDGYTMKVFKNDPNDSTTLPNNYCSAITEDSDGFIWIGVFGNIIARFNPIDESFKRIPIETGGVTNISEYPAALTDADGNIWFGTTNHGMLRLNRSTSRFEKVSLDTTQSDNANWGQISAIIELKNGNILASDYGSGIKIYNKNLDLFQSFYLKANYSPAEIGVIFEDDAGNIWFGGKSLLIKYSPSYYMVENYDIFSDFQIPTKYDFITGIEQDADGYIWVGIYSQGLYRINQNTKAVGKFEYTSDKSTSGQDVLWTLFRDRYGVIWIGTWYGGLYKFDPLREPFTYTKLKVPEILNSGTNYVTAISGSQQRNEITVGTSARGLFSYNPETKKTTHLNLKFDPATLIDGLTNIQSLCVDDLGNTYLSYNNLGLYGFGEDHVIYSIKSPHWGKTSSYIANTMKMDLAGNIWIASRHGFEKFNPVTSEFSLLPTIMNKQMSKDLKSAVKTISETRQSIASILKVGEASNAEKKFSLSQDQKVLVICLGEGRMVQGNDVLFDTGSLMTGDGRLLWSMNDLSKTFNDGGGFKNRIAVKCIDLKQGDYKIAFSSDVGHSYGNYNVTAPPDSQWWGIQVFKIDDSEQSNISELNEQEIQSDRYMPMEIGTSIEISKRIYNVLWLGSMNNSFFKYDLVTGDFKQYNYDTKNKFSPNNSITCIFEDREGIVWIATLNTLIRFDPVTEKIVKFDQKDGLPSNLINSIVEDLQGNLWINTSGGLSKLNKNAPQGKWSFVNFDTRDGLRSYSSSKAAWISRNGEIVLGSNDGLVSFFPGKINAVKPDVVIEDIKISDVSIKTDPEQVNLKRSIPKLDKLDLSYKQNNLSFEFASIHFSRPAKNKIAYRMDGFNDHWVSTDRNFTSFTNLDPGEYTFRVKGSNGDGIWDENGEAIQITIHPPWWQTTFAYFSYFFLFLGLIFGIDRVQRRRILTRERNAAAIKEANLRAQLAEKENERKSKELEEARSLQLSMLPKELPKLPNLDIAVYMKTATEVGGDYYDFHVGIDGTLTVVIGDATGHGMKAGTMVTTAKSLFRSYAPNPDIRLCFSEFTRCIKEMNFEKLSMCMTMIKIQKNKLKISSAGMPPSFIYRRDTQSIEEHLLKGMPLGTMDKFPYEVNDTTLKPGDTILLITDGLPELKNDAAEMFGYKRVRNTFEEVAEKAPDEIIDVLKNEGSLWVNDQEPDDDVTFVVIKVK